MNIGSGNFQPMSQSAASPVLSGIQQGLEAHLKLLQNKKAKAQLPYAGPEEAAKLKHMDLGNQGDEAVLPYKGPQAAASLQQSQLKNTLQQIINHYMPEQQQAEIGQKKAMSNFYNMGGGRGGVQNQAQMAAKKLISQMNPQLNDDPNKLLDAQNAYETGQSKLSDGTPLAPMNPVLSQAISTAILHSTTAPLATQGVKSNQSESAINSIQGMIKSDMKPYGTTFFGHSPQAIVDSFKSDPASQKRLGNFMAATGIQFEQALLRTAMSGGPAGIRALNQMMHDSQQYIQQKYPKVSGTARQQANNRFNEYFEQIRQGRNKVGTSLINLPESNYQANNSPSSEDSQSAPKVGTVVKGYTYIGGPPGDKDSWSKN